MKNIFVIVAALFATPALADYPTLDYVKDIKSIKVDLVDDAENACWTNLSETREYAEEKIRIAGGNVYVSTGFSRRWKDDYDLRITVRSHRAGNDKCFGFIMVDLITTAQVNDMLHTASARGGFTYFTNAPNANTLVIEAVQSFFQNK